MESQSLTHRARLLSLDLMATRGAPRKQRQESLKPPRPVCRIGLRDKICYRSRAAARAAVKRSTRRLRAYRCEICGLWHLTSRVAPRA